MNSLGCISGGHNHSGESHCHEHEIHDDHHHDVENTTMEVEMGNSSLLIT